MGIKMSESFLNLSDLYTHLEADAMNICRMNRIASLFKPLRDQLIEKKDDDAQKAQWEVDFFNFNITEDKLSPHYTGVNEKGEQIEYPSFLNFTEDTFNYLAGRFDYTKNALLKSRYAHLLWLSPKKHHKYARAALDSYIELFSELSKLDMNDPEGPYGLSLYIVTGNMLKLHYILDTHGETIRKMIIDKILSYKDDHFSAAVVRKELINYMLKYDKLFIFDDFQQIGLTCIRFAQYLSDKGDHHGSIIFYEYGKNIDDKYALDYHNWTLGLAEQHELLMEKAIDNLTASHFCIQAIEYYGQTGMEEKVDELRIKYEEMSKSFELSSIPYPKHIIDLFEKYEEESKVFAKETAMRSPSEILQYMTLSLDLVPSYESIVEAANNPETNSVMLDLIPISPIDQSGNAPEHFVDDEEKKRYKFLTQYDHTMRFNLILIRAVFLEACKSGNFSYDSLYDHLKNNSWLGRSITHQSPSGEKWDMVWLDLLSPGLKEYFTQMDYSIQSGGHYPNLVLTIDSITLKIEGILRDICTISGIPTFYQTKDKKGREITREKDIHSLLYEKKVVELLPDSDLYFLRYVLVEKMGFNLRHKVAHSLLRRNEYVLEYIQLLILCLLRLANFVLEEKDAT